MSHFCVLVVTKHDCSTDEGQDELAARLQPFHEFECTGTDDQYVKDVDQTEEARREYSTSTVKRYRDPEGNLHDPYLDRFYREWTKVELAQQGRVAPMGTGWSGDISFHSKDWGDGKGYRSKVHYMPSGWTKVEVPRSETETFAEYVDDYYGKKIVPYGQKPDLNDAHKFGYALTDEHGEIVKVIDRTNPDKKWDWWTIGGRYSKRLVTADGGKVDFARKGDVDLAPIIAEKRAHYGAMHDRAHKVLAGQTFESWETVRARFGDDIKGARAWYWEQAGVQALKNVPEFVWSDADEFLLDREAFASISATRSVQTFAFLGLDGVWKERGNMGWWGVVSDEKDQGAWEREWMRAWDAVGADEYVTVVDCHI